MSNQPIKKAIFPIAGRATRFLPLSKVVSKELIPLVDKPLIHYTVLEAISSGIKEIVFVTRPQQKDVFQYFQSDPELEKLLREQNKNNELETLKEIQEFSKNVSFSFVIQKEPEGDADAIFQANSFIGQESCGVFFCDDVIDAQPPGFLQLAEVFETCQRPVMALKRLPSEKLSHYGVVEVEKIANRFYKIKGMVEKPEPKKAPSDLAIIGRLILTPDVFDYLKTEKMNKKQELTITITKILGNMAREGQAIYGYEIKGEWVECGDKLRWFYSFLHFAIKHPQLGPQVKRYLKKLKI